MPDASDTWTRPLAPRLRAAVARAISGISTRLCARVSEAALAGEAVPDAGLDETVRQIATCHHATHGIHATRGIARPNRSWGGRHVVVEPRRTARARCPQRSASLEITRTRRSPPAVTPAMAKRSHEEHEHEYHPENPTLSSSLGSCSFFGLILHDRTRKPFGLSRQKQAPCQCARKGCEHCRSKSICRAGPGRQPADKSRMIRCKKPTCANVLARAGFRPADRR